MDIQKLKRSVELMHKTGADDSQYLLVPLCDIEVLIEAWERDQILQEWLKSIYRAIREVDDGTERYSAEETADPEGPGEERPSGDPDGLGGEMGDHGDEREETGPEEHYGETDILSVPEVREGAGVSEEDPHG